MNFTNLTLEKLEKAAINFKIEKDNTYINSYPEFIKYFVNIKEINENNFIISSHFVYGWMPTILNLNKSNLKEVLVLLNKAKIGYDFDESQLEILKQCINNSISGTSKLLHFINPNYYAIWDSRVLKFITGNSTIYGVDKVENYMKYLTKMKVLENDSQFEKLYIKIKDKFDYPITPLRAIEVLMFVTNKNLG